MNGWMLQMINENQDAQQKMGEIKWFLIIWSPDSFTGASVMEQENWLTWAKTYQNKAQGEYLKSDQWTYGACLLQLTHKPKSRASFQEVHATSKWDQQPLHDCTICGVICCINADALARCPPTPPHRCCSALLPRKQQRLVPSSFSDMQMSIKASAESTHLPVWCLHWSMDSKH